MSRERRERTRLFVLAGGIALFLGACFPVCLPLPEYPCESHDECNPPRYCSDGFCASGGGCQTDAGCPEEGVPCTSRCETAGGHTYRCPIQPGTCGRLHPCDEDADCPFGLPCIGFCEDEDGETYLCEDLQEFCSELDPQPRSIGD